jgi:hypothetical protein
VAEKELRTELAKAIVAHAVSGVSDPQELFKLALKTLHQEERMPRSKRIPVKGSQNRMGAIVIDGPP